MKTAEKPISIQNFNRIKGAFIAQGISFSEWCRNNSVTPSNAKSALIGAWDGPKARLLRNKLIRDSGVYTDGNESTQLELDGGFDE